MLTKTAKTFVDLYIADVTANPDAYKAMIRANPEVYAIQMIEHLDESEALQLLRDFRQELRLIPC